MKIVIDSDIPYIKGALEPFADVVYMKGNAVTTADVADADAMIVRTRTRCDRTLLEHSRVRMIATATIGFDHIDMEYCSAAGIKVSTAAGSNARGVLQWIGAALAYAAAEQGWTPEQKTIGVVGTGHVGSLVARYAADWGFRVLCCDPPLHAAAKAAPCSDGGFVTLGEIADRADIVTFHTPLTLDGPDKTYHMAGESFFGSLRPGALIINSSRGEVIDTAALLQALRDGRCSACVDTWEHEPAIDRELLRSALLATPHVAGYSAQGKANATSMSVRAVAREFGLPPTEWYPYGDVPKVAPAPISWPELVRTIKTYCDIAAETALLKSHPEGFETMRNSYKYRAEYF